MEFYLIGYYQFYAWQEPKRHEVYDGCRVVFFDVLSSIKDHHRPALLYALRMASETSKDLCVHSLTMIGHGRHAISFLDRMMGSNVGLIADVEKLEVSSKLSAQELIQALNEASQSMDKLARTAGGLKAKGKSGRRSKLDSREQDRLMSLFKTGDYDSALLAHEFGISRTSVNRIIRQYRAYEERKPTSVGAERQDSDEPSQDDGS